MEEFKSKIKRFPSSPGVYIFENKKGSILYIGRAAVLKKRILSYVQRNLDPRLQEMVDKAYKIRYKRADSVLEAIILEANLIKKHWPKYNIRERDNRSFIYIVIDTKDKYPRPAIVRGREIEKFTPLEIRRPKAYGTVSDSVSLMGVGAHAKVFGPYKSLSTVGSALRIIRRIFPYSTCSPAVASAKAGKPCFNYSVGLCPGVCIGKISQNEYRKNINNIISMLRGQKKRLVKKLAKENPLQARALQHISDVSLLTRSSLSSSHLEIQMRRGAVKQSSTTPRRIEGYDISHLTGKETGGSMVVFTGNKPDKSQYRLFTIKHAQPHNDLAALEEVIIRRLRHTEWRFPDLIVIDGGRPQITHISKVLRARSVDFPLVGISKYGGDKLVFASNIKKSLKELIRSMKPTLLQVRNEAHRFAITFSRKKRKISSVAKK
ncbi:GIY-YIG nuclease family protein [Patescibacteria group bacterium AH-259-L07]|nr:GIY-YIG nuclease family protein [Patescibacteria group bacterium AH-259-L07]